MLEWYSRHSCKLEVLLVQQIEGLVGSVIRHEINTRPDIGLSGGGDEGER